ncbi:hypothetical protein [Plasmodium yoelii yoelii]|uniref:Uncharacterized protein n=1 Tax=Plasmodium yoelii yoelii TaxID=73239 RepID=Q7RJT4_PLAYO|nr:hypothetical protein [Plasmodium yoelii yoelii]
MYIPSLSNIKKKTKKINKTKRKPQKDIKTNLHTYMYACICIVVYLIRCVEK